MEFFIRAKAWKMFFLIIGIPAIFQYFVFSIIVKEGGFESGIIFTLMPILILIIMSIFLSWFWVLGTRVNNFISEEIRPKAKFFKFSVKYSAVYMLVFQLFFISSSNGFPVENVFPIIIPLHFFGMYCMFYGLYFISKNIVTAELNQEVTFSKYASTFFLLWLYPIGIWFVQPRVNSLNAKYT